ncbi:MAG: type II toxin-antitoxin system VapB family antitoxin [Actinomycetota bacterium]|jgi:Arc/MetJ family transcription regulator
MGTTTIDIDTEACAAVMRRFGLASKDEAVNFALRSLVVEPLTVPEALALEGSGWIGDLDQMRDAP